jgi:hypothetical protein
MEWIAVTNTLGVISIVCLLLAIIIFLHLVQRAFGKEGIIWGFIATLYPPGTYFFCRKNWDQYRTQFITITALLLTSLALWIIVKLLV